MMGSNSMNPFLSVKTATSNAAKVLSWSGPMNPYKDGPLGVIVEGAYADIILVDGNPLNDISVLGRKSVDFVMKDGLVYKNLLVDPEHETFRGTPAPVGHSFNM
jgi:imidazolonepropionase-like amidohydrolase